MKATGIVRRIDDLGRIVIPKEIRRVLHIKESDPIEIFAGREGEIILKKYSPVGELDHIAGDIVDSMYAITGKVSCITDREGFVAVSGSRKRELEGRTLSRKLEEAIEKRKAFSWSAEKHPLPLTDKEDLVMEQGYVLPIICQGDCMGSLVLIGKRDEAFNPEAYLDILRLISTFISRQLEL